jgi:hypothetical protein
MDGFEVRRQIKNNAKSAVKEECGIADWAGFRLPVPVVRPQDVCRGFPSLTIPRIRI